jgi:hypothetical protein
MNVVATSLWDVCLFAVAFSERRIAPWLQGGRTYDAKLISLQSDEAG